MVFAVSQGATRAARNKGREDRSLKCWPGKNMHNPPPTFLAPFSEDSKLRIEKHPATATHRNANSGLPVPMSQCNSAPRFLQEALSHPRGAAILRHLGAWVGGTLGCPCSLRKLQGKLPSAPHMRLEKWIRKTHPSPSAGCQEGGTKNPTPNPQLGPSARKRTGTLSN